MRFNNRYQQVDRYRLRSHEAQRQWFTTETACNEAVRKFKSALDEERERERNRLIWERLRAMERVPWA